MVQLNMVARRWSLSKSRAIVLAQREPQSYTGFFGLAGHGGGGGGWNPPHLYNFSSIRRI